MSKKATIAMLHKMRQRINTKIGEKYAELYDSARKSVFVTKATTKEKFDSEVKAALEFEDKLSGVNELLSDIETSFNIKEAIIKNNYENGVIYLLNRKAMLDSKIEKLTRIRAYCVCNDVPDFEDIQAMLSDTTRSYVASIGNASNEFKEIIDKALAELKFELDNIVDEIAFLNQSTHVEFE